MADAADSKSVGRKPMKVRLLSPAPTPARLAPPLTAMLRCHSECTVPSSFLGNRAFAISVGTRVEESLLISYFLPKQVSFGQTQPET